MQVISGNDMMYHDNHFLLSSSVNRFQVNCRVTVAELALIGPTQNIYKLNPFTKWVIRSRHWAQPTDTAWATRAPWQRTCRQLYSLLAARGPCWCPPWPQPQAIGKSQVPARQADFTFLLPQTSCYRNLGSEATEDSDLPPTGLLPLSRSFACLWNK